LFIRNRSVFFRTNHAAIHHATFFIYDDYNEKEKYCRGIVFSVSDARAKLAEMLTAGR